MHLSRLIRQNNLFQPRVVVDRTARNQPVFLHRREQGGGGGTLYLELGLYILLVYGVFRMEYKANHPGVQTRGMGIAFNGFIEFNTVDTVAYRVVQAAYFISDFPVAYHLNASLSARLQTDNLLVY